MCKPPIRTGELEGLKTLKWKRELKYEARKNKDGKNLRSEINGMLRLHKAANVNNFECRFVNMQNGQKIISVILENRQQR